MRNGCDLAATRNTVHGQCSAAPALLASAKGIAHSPGAAPPQCGAQLSSTRGRSQGATSGSRGGHPSTSAMPAKETSQGAPPRLAAAATSAWCPVCSASNLPSATMGGPGLPTASLCKGRRQAAML